MSWSVNSIPPFSNFSKRKETWLFIPEKLNSYLSWERKILLNFTCGFNLPIFAFCPIQNPPGYGPQSILDTLSKHSPAASSKVHPSLLIIKPANSSWWKREE